MKKIYFALAILITFSVLMSGCTQTDTTDSGEEKVTVTNSDEANQTLNDASVDITGIDNTLSDLDDSLE